jgi:hypothetical protein
VVFGEHNSGHGKRSAEDIGKERRWLVSVWEGLVETVQQLPQFEYFLRPIPFSQLRQASTTGQVIIINSSEYQVDALIFDAMAKLNMFHFLILTLKHSLNCQAI